MSSVLPPVLGSFAGQLWRGPTPEPRPSSVPPATSPLLELVVPSGFLNAEPETGLGTGHVLRGAL